MSIVSGGLAHALRVPAPRLSAAVDGATSEGSAHEADELEALVLMTIKEKVERVLKVLNKKRERLSSEAIAIRADLSMHQTREALRMLQTQGRVLRYSVSHQFGRTSFVYRSIRRRCV